jgi:mono/diheme cytochrome c family protein
MRHSHLYMHSPFVVFIVESVLCVAIFAEEGVPQKPSSPLPESGRELYRISCAACHGSDGRGTPAGLVGFSTPLPDFTDCNFSTREAEADWAIVVAEGGPARGFSEIMPAFGNALSEEQVRKILLYIRTLSDCGEWPRGELNLPRALFTTKA